MSVELKSIVKKDEEGSYEDNDVKVDTTDLSNGKAAHDTNGSLEQHGEEIKEVPPTEVKLVGVFEMFKFATWLDRLFMIIGTLGGLIHGGGMPLLFIVFGNVADTFVRGEKLDSFLKYYDVEDQRALILENSTYFESLIESLNATRCYSVENLKPPDLNQEIGGFALYYVGLACAVIFCAYIENTFWSLAAERQTRRMREEFFRAIMRQDIGWFDVTEAGGLNSRITEDIAKIHDGIGDKLGTFFEFFSRALVGITVAFSFGWQLSLVVMSLSPALILAAAFMGRLVRKMTIDELKAYARAGSIAEEVISSVRTVMAFGGEGKECERYQENLVFAKKAGIKKGLTQGLGMGFFNLVMFAQYALGFWYGAKLTVDQCETYSAGTMFTVFFNILIAAMSLGSAAPTITDFSTARGAAYEVFNIIRRTPPIDCSSEEGKKPDEVEGVLEFKHVAFAYPSRPEVQVMRDFNLKVEKGSTVALVGPSGCGKSTTVQLLQRFYDPLAGEIEVDGIDIRDLNTKWLRQHIGIVSQEPILFETTIGENIRFGRPDVTMDEIIQATKMANAHDFISQLPEKYETMVGERGARLSGGQKQRIAIARALVRDPKILLLDEATSALDTESESVVQSALDKARMGRTTIIIAHRLTTVRTADLIVGIENGEVKEMGTHRELMEKEGLYCQLVTAQQIDKDQEIEDIDEEDITVEQFKRAVSRMSGATDPMGSSHFNASQRSLKRGTSAQKPVEEEEEKLEVPPFSRIIKYNAKEWYFILIGCIAAIGNGAIMPAFAVVYASLISVFIEVNPVKKADDAQLYACLFLVVGVGGGITYFLQNFLFSISGERLTERLRGLAFKTILQQEISWFDDHRNSTGTLTTRLATDASGIQGATGARIATFLQNVTGMGVAIILAFIFSWRLTLVCVAFVPFVAMSMFLRMNLMTNSAQKDKKAMEGAGKIFLEAAVNVRTVASLSLENHFIGIFDNYLLTPHKENMRKIHLWGFVYGFSQGVMFFSHAATFTYAAYLIDLSATDPDINIKFEDVMKVFACIIFGAMGLGRASSFAADYGKATAAAARVFHLFDRVPEIDNYSTDGDRPEDYTPAVEFRDVRFVYPTRPSVKVLRGLNVSVSPGQTLALVGSSGCGKSTTVQLMERFYDPVDGGAMLDHRDLRSLNLSWLRQQIGLVSQEPVLFDRTIRENIAYGDNTRERSMDEIIEAARKANIHSFIESLPLGYETSVGDKGTQLSGGQKQRIAIARALIRNPKILLLDEATSALDSESEKVVQEALDKAREGRTSIVIAHRLSTIQNADKIVVIFNGRVVEQGTHHSLMKEEGFYYSLQTVQQNAN